MLLWVAIRLARAFLSFCHWIFNVRPLWLRCRRGERWAPGLWIRPSGFRWRRRPFFSTTVSFGSQIWPNCPVKLEYRSRGTPNKRWVKAIALFSSSVSLSHTHMQTNIKSCIQEHLCIYEISVSFCLFNVRISFDCHLKHTLRNNGSADVCKFPVLLNLPSR